MKKGRYKRRILGQEGGKVGYMKVESGKPVVGVEFTNVK